MAITGITGIGSGLDIKGIVEAMVNSEKAPKTAQLNRLERATTEKFSGLGQFRSALSEFQNVLKDLNNPALFEKRSASSGKTDIFTVSADAKAAAGNYSVQVFNLAQTSKVALRGVDDPAAAIGTGSMTISAGDKTLNLTISEANNSLTGIRDAINTAGKSAGISATIVNDPSGVGGARLVLSSSEFGTGNDINVTSSSTSGDLSVLDFSVPPTTDFVVPDADPDNPRDPRVISYARDASLAIDGIAVTSAGNVIDDVIEGVTLTLKSAQSAEDITNANTVNLTVGEDRSGVKNSVKRFVEAYNKLMGTIESLTKVTPVGGDDGQPLAAALVGDASVRSFMTATRSELGSPAGDGPLRILADMGISTQRDGSLKIDDARLDAVLTDNFDQLNGFLTGKDGLMARLESKVKPYAEAGGILESRTKALQNTLASVDSQREQLNRRVGQMESRLLAQFNAMDSLVGRLSQTSDYLAGQLNNLPGVVRQDRN